MGSFILNDKVIWYSKVFRIFKRILFLDVVWFIVVCNCTDGLFIPQITWVRIIWVDHSVAFHSLVWPSVYWSETLVEFNFLILEYFQCWFYDLFLFFVCCLSRCLFLHKIVSMNIRTCCGLVMMSLVRGRFSAIKIRYFFVHFGVVLSLVFRVGYSNLVKNVFHVLFFSEICITHFGSLFALAKTGTAKLITKIINLLTVPHFRCFCVFNLFDFKWTLLSFFWNSVDFSEFFILILYKSDCIFIWESFIPVKISLLYPIKKLRPAYGHNSIFELEAFVWIHIPLFHSCF